MRSCRIDPSQFAKRSPTRRQGSCWSPVEARWAERITLHELLAACKYSFDETGRDVTLEYMAFEPVPAWEITIFTPTGGVVSCQVPVNQLEQY